MPHPEAGGGAVGLEGGGVACQGGDPGSSSACIASKVIAGMHQERVALSRSLSRRRELAGARDPILYALTHLRDGTGSIDAVQHDLPLLCLIVHELLLQELARLRDAGRAVRLVCRWAESRTRLAGARLLLQLLRLPQLPFGLRLRSGPRAHAHERECEQEDHHRARHAKSRRRRVRVYGMPDAATYRVPVPRT